MSFDKILKSICIITASVIAFSATSASAASDFEMSVSGEYSAATCAEKTEIVTFDAPVNARGKLLSVGLRLDSVQGNAQLYLDGTGICIDTDVSKTADTIVKSEGTRGESDSGYFATDNTKIHALQFYIPDSSDIVTIFLDGRMVGDELINNVTEEFIEYVRPLIEGELSQLTVNGLPQHIRLG